MRTNWIRDAAAWIAGVSFAVAAGLSFAEEPKPEPAPAAPADPAPAPAPAPALAPPPVVAPPPLQPPQLAIPLLRQRMRARLNRLGNDEMPEPPPRYNLKADPDSAEQDRVNNRLIAEQLLEEGRNHAASRLADDDPREAIDAALSLLEANRRLPAQPVSRIDICERLLELDWGRKPKESTEQLVRRLTADPLAAQLAAGPEGLLELEDYRENYLAQLAPRYEEAAGASWPFQWRTNEKFWLDFLAALVEGERAADGAAFWKERVEKDAERAEWHRAAYVASLRQSAGQLDLAILAPWLAPKPQVDPDQIALLGELVKTAAVAEPDETAEIRRQLRGRFLAELARLPVTEAKFDERVGSVLGELWQSEFREGRDALQQILNHDSPWLFYRLVQQIGLDGAIAQRMMQGRKVKVAFKDKPVGEAVKELEAKVVLSLWIDDDVLRSKTKLSLDREGPWLDVLDAALASTNFRAIFLPQRVLWIGPLEKSAAARATLTDAMAKIGSAADFPYHVLAAESYGDDELSAWSFDNLPLADVLTAIKEKASFALDCPEEAVSKAKVTFHCRDLPLPLVLALVAKSAGAEWDVVGTSIVFGTPKKMAELRELVQRHERRMAALAGRDDRVSKALREASGTSASGTELADLLAYMQQTHEIGLGYFAASDAGPSPAKELSLESRESWAWDLDVLTFQIGLGWDHSADGVWLLRSPTLDKARRLAEARAKGAAPNDEARQLLATTVTIRVTDQTLEKIAPREDEEERLDIQLDFSRLSAELRKKKFHGAFVELPLAATLDLIAAECDARWELAGKSVRFVPQ